MSVQGTPVAARWEKVFSSGMLAEVGDKDVEVTSGGLATYSGWGASKEAVEACQEMQVDISAHRSSAVNLERIRRSDLILVMSNSHRDRIIQIEPMATKKVRLLGEFEPNAKKVEIDDPVGQSLEVFRKCAERIFAAMKGVMNRMEELKQSRQKVKSIAIGADHRGFELRKALIEYLSSNDYDVADCGVYESGSADHPDQAFAVGELVSDQKVDRGILICGSGVGMSIAANKVPGIYAAIIREPEGAKLARQHNGANVLCLPADHVSPEAAQEIVETFLKTDALNGEEQRYQRRRDKIRNYELDHYKHQPDEEE